jgi:eukaryotic-like serine/threonine-protein kinase
MTQTRANTTFHKYNIGPLIGAGGMGAVYKADPIEGGPSVAIKFLLDEYVQDINFQGRFVREMRILQDMRHENIMPIYESGLHNGHLYYTMRLINGMTLTQMMKRARFKPLTYWEVLRQLSAALTYGHENNLVHRDVKPDNVFIEMDRTSGSMQVFLGDFGLGKREGKDATLTEADAVLGTPQYISPEGATGEKLDGRADLYSVAVITYEVLLGVLPFNEAHGHLTAMAHVMKPVPLPTSINPAFPPPLEEVLLLGLRKDREDRPSTVTAFAEAYRKALDNLTEQERNTNYQK